MITPTQPITHTFRYPTVGDFAGGAEIQDISPTDAAATRRALKAGRDTTGIVRHVHLTSKSGSIRGGLEVTGPADGTPLLVTITSGMYPLRVLSGNVLVFASSSWGNAAEAFGSSVLTVLVGHGCKQSTTAHDHATVNVIGHEGARGLQIIRGTQGHAALTITGEHHRLHLISDSDPCPF